MYRTFIVIATLLLSTYLATSQSLKDQYLISYYNFDKDANDLVGKNHGEVHGATIVEGRCGDRCYYFDGAEDYIDFGNDPSLNEKVYGFSISVWVRPDEITSLELGTIVAKWGFDPDIDHFGIWISPHYKIVAAFSAPGQMENGIFSTSEITPNEWHHVVAMWHYKSRKVRIYIDGKLDKEGDQTGRGLNTNSPLSLKMGRQVVRRSRPFKGYLDELRLYKKPLSEEEVQNLYSIGKLVCEHIELVGTVIDRSTKKPVPNVEVRIERLSNSSLYKSLKTDESGRYLIKLPLNEEYAIYAKADEYMSENTSLNTGKFENGTQVNKDLFIIPVKVGESLRLNNIFFDFAKASLRPESHAELDRILPLFEMFPTLKVEVAGHTDNVGSDIANEKLSQERANSVREYLISKGVTEEKIVSVGYGESKPIATNDTDDGRQQNRRVEFVILEK